MKNDELLGRQLLQLKKMYRRDIGPLVRRSWVFRGKHAAPVVDLGFPRRIPRFRTPLKNFYLASMCHLYPDERSVNNSIRVAAELARAMGFGQEADHVPRGLNVAAKYGHSDTGDVVFRREAKAA
jgi:hypothetical protein